MVVPMVSSKAVMKVVPMARTMAARLGAQTASMKVVLKAP